MKRQDLVARIWNKKNFLCVGLDPDMHKIPAHFHTANDPIFEFNKAIIDATKDICVAYKPNLAFYECHGKKGWESLEKTMEYIPKDIFTIADAKRGDIGNTSKMYAKTFFEYFDFDAVTVAPYMGEDSVSPFLEFEDKWVILLSLTSNKGSYDFQQITDENGKKLYISVIEKAKKWGNPNNLMFVVGATHSESFSEIRSVAEDYFLLVPGVGAQGGSLEDVVTYGRNKDIGLLINSSRDIIYAGEGVDFQIEVRKRAIVLQQQMAKYF